MTREATFTLAALSWRSPRTITQSLASWDVLATTRSCVQRLAYVQEQDTADVQAVRRHGFEAVGDANNIGIGPAYRELLDRATGEFFVFLECDWRLTRHRDAVAHLQRAAWLIQQDEVQLVRLRSRRRPGWPINPSQLQNRELAHPYWLLDMSLWEPRPERIYPEHLTRLDALGERWVVAAAQHAGWTNNPHIARTDWLREHVRPFTTGPGTAFEGLIDAHWSSLPIRVAQGRGLFTHDRVDGPGHRDRSLHHRIGYPLRLQARRPLRRFTR